MTKTKLQLVREKGVDTKEWQKLYHKYPQEYIRRRLRFIEDCVSNKSPDLNRLQIQSNHKLNARYDIWINNFLTGGLAKLCTPIVRKVANRMTDEQKLELKNIILTQTPLDHRIDRNIWTAEVIIELIKTKWNMSYKDSRIYQILNSLGLSHQKAHRDYANSDPALREERRDIMEKKQLIQKEIISKQATWLKKNW